MSGTVLAELERDMGSVSFGSCSDEELRGLVQRALCARQVVDGFVNQLTAEARRREATGCGAPAEEIIRSGGKISQREAKTLDRRAGVGEVLPQVGDAVDSGAARSENADILARQLDGLTDTQRAALASSDAEIARQAAWAPPETFARWLGRRVRAITEATPADGETRDERQRAASTFGMKRRGDGMWDLFGCLDQTRGAELHDVITRAARQLNNGEATPNARVDALHQLTTRRPASKSSSEGLDGFDPGAKMGIGYIVDAATLTGGPHAGSLAQTWPETTSTLTRSSAWPVTVTCTRSCTTSWASRPRSGAPTGQQPGNSGSNYAACTSGARWMAHHSATATSTTSTSPGKTAAKPNSTT